MSNLIGKADFVKYKFYKAQNVEITAIFDYHTRRHPDLVSSSRFTLDGSTEHTLHLFCVDGEPVFTLDDNPIPLSGKEGNALIHAVLSQDHAFRLAHPDCVTLFVDSDRLLEVLPHE